MAKIALVHGYGSGTTSKILKRMPQEYAGFSAFKHEVKTKEAAVFKWYVEEDFPNLEYLYNVARQLKVYKKEHQLARSHELRVRFGEFLELEKPQVVVAFSLGSMLAFTYFELFGVPGFVHTLVTVQADLPDNFKFTNPDIIKRFESKSLRWINFYCPWDMLLPFSIIVNKAVPSGIRGSKNKYAENRLFPLLGKWNIHTGSINDAKFRDAVVNLLT
ncbi:MAG: hypothetical protein M3Q44_05820 [bacterium]|nr:hypothetical protein [bacterium]